jgi:hypothetical protein
VISELDRYHGVVLRKILVSCGAAVRVGVVDRSGRVDAFRVEDAAFQIKHSSKRLSPWQFTYVRENLLELSELRDQFQNVWVFLVCGQDGVVGLAYEELATILPLSEAGSTWIRVRRSRNSMYRVSGPLGDLGRAKPRGVQSFLAIALGVTAVVEGEQVDDRQP